MLAGRLAVLAALVLPVNAAEARARMTMASRASAGFRAELERMQAERRKSEETLNSTVSVGDALAILQGRRRANATALSLIERGLHSGGRAAPPRLRAHPAKSLLQEAAAHKKRRSVNQAVTTLNGMIKTTTEEYDEVHRECQQFFKKQCSLMETAREDISSANSLAAEWRGKVLGAQSEINVCEVRIPRLKEDLATSVRECDRRLGYLRRDLQVVMNDIGTMETVLNLTQCTGPPTLLLAEPGPGLLQCNHPCRNGSFVVVAHRAVHRSLAALRSRHARQLVQEGLAELAEQEAEGADAAAQDLTAAATTAAPTTAAPQVTAFENPPLPQQALPEDPCQSIAYDSGDGKGGCTLRKTPQCYNLQNKFLSIQGEILDKKNDLLEEIGNFERACEEAKQTLEAEIQSYTTRMSDEHTKLADATSGENTAAEQGQMKAREHSELKSSMLQTRTSCSAKLRSLEAETCALKKIRGELNKMESTNHLFYQDCEVAENWEEGECSASCGGGLQQLTRAVIVPASGGGAECPPLVTQQRCNEQPCPIHCKMSQWSGFSACSADCGGGVSERTRTIRQQARYEGDPCGETEETVPCNMQACDKDCVLAPWSRWSDCSKFCDAGSRTRRRAVAEAAVGRGKCPGTDSPRRLQRKACNTQACPRDATRPLLCKSKVDVVLLLDASGSVGQTGWDATKNFAKKFVDAFDDAGSGTSTDAQVSIIQFSGPYKWSLMRKCIGMGAQSSAVNMESDCMIKVNQHFKSDLAATKTVIGALPWKKGTTLTSAALELARSELTLGRADAQKVVLVMTDGIPLSSRSTWIAATRLKRQARLMFGAVKLNSRGLRYMRAWGSSPARENVLRINSFRDLESLNTIDSLISDMCKNVAVPRAASSGR